MNNICFDKKYESGIEIIDRDKKNIIENLNGIVQFDEKSLINLLFSFKYSLADEECFLLDIKYPETNMQKEKHKEFIDKLENLIYKKEENKQIFLEISNFLNSHLEEDKKIGEYYKDL